MKNHLRLVVNNKDIIETTPEEWDEILANSTWIHKCINRGLQSPVLVKNDK